MALPGAAESYRIRPGSGGRGRWRGGHGGVRRLRFGAPMTVTTLTGHRRVPAFPAWPAASRARLAGTGSSTRRFDHRHGGLRFGPRRAGRRIRHPDSGRGRIRSRREPLGRVGFELAQYGDQRRLVPAGVVEHRHQRVQHQVPVLAGVEQPLRGLPQLRRVTAPEPVGQHQVPFDVRPTPPGAGVAWSAASSARRSRGSAGSRMDRSAPECQPSSTGKANARRGSASRSESGSNRRTSA